MRWHLITVAFRISFSSQIFMIGKHYSSPPSEKMEAVSDACVQWEGRSHADVWMTATVTYLLDRLQGMSSVSSRIISDQAELNENCDRNFASPCKARVSLHKEGHMLSKTLTPGHLEAVGQDSSSDDRPAGTTGSVWVRDELNHLAGVALPFWVVCRHLGKVH